MYIYHRADGVYIHGFYFFALFPRKGKKKPAGWPFSYVVVFFFFLFCSFFLLYDLRMLYLGSPMELITYNVFMLQGPEPAGSQQLLSQKKHTLSHCTFFCFLPSFTLKRLPFFLSLVMLLIALLLKRVAGKKSKKRDDKNTKTKRNTVHAPHPLFTHPVMPPHL